MKSEIEITAYNESVRLIKVILLTEHNLKAFKVFLETMEDYPDIYVNAYEDRKCYEEIIKRYEETGVLEELSTNI